MNEVGQLPLEIGLELVKGSSEGSCDAVLGYHSYRQCARHSQPSKPKWLWFDGGEANAYDIPPITTSLSLLPNGISCEHQKISISDAITPTALICSVSDGNVHEFVSTKLMTGWNVLLSPTNCHLTPRPGTGTCFAIKLY